MPISQSATSTTSPKPLLTFVVNDAGETKAFQPVMAMMAKKGIPFTVIASQTSQQLLPNKPDQVVKFDPAMDQFVPNPVTLNQSITAPLVITGLSSTQQAFWADWFKQRGSRVIGYIDSLTTQQVPGRFISSLSAVWTPTPVQAEAVARKTGLPTKAVGQPALKQFQTEVASMDKWALRRQNHIPEQATVMMWAGGYGPGYENAFAKFLDYLRQYPSVMGTVALHPGQTGQLEANVLSHYPDLQARCRIFPSSVTTTMATAMADSVAMHDSTVGIQAWLCGKPVRGFDQPSVPDALAGQTGFTRLG